MSKKATKALILCALLSLLTGCYPTGELEQPDKPAANNSTSADGNSEPNTFNIPNDLKNVKFNFELDGDHPTELPVIKAKGHWFDAEAMKAMFVDMENIWLQQLYCVGFFAALSAVLGLCL